MNLPLRRILCPTDFSDPSYEALEVARQLALQFGSELVLVHVISPVPALPYAPTTPNFNVPLFINELEAAARASLERLVGQRLGGPPPVKVRTAVVHGAPAEELLRLAEEVDPDLIVIATHGRQGWRRWVFGSVAEKLVRMSDFPVLTVRAPRGQDA